MLRMSRLLAAIDVDDGTCASSGESAAARGAHGGAPRRCIDRVQTAAESHARRKLSALRKEM
jgi:hypothetical protein